MKLQLMRLRPTGTKVGLNSPAPATESPASTAPQPIKFGWRVEYAAYVAVEALIGCLPGNWVARMGRGLGRLAHAFATKRRRTVRRNLRIVYAGEKSLAEVDALTKEVFCRTGANLFSALHTARLDAAGLLSAIEVEGADEFAAVLGSGQGAVVILAHMGNWEALAQVFPRLLPGNVKSGTVYRPLNNPLLDARMETARGQAGLALFSKRDTPLAMTAFLKEGGALGILSDQRAGNTGELVPFFGRLTSCSPLPSIFARRSGAKVVGVSVRTISAGRWAMKLHPLGAVKPDTQACMRLLEEVIRESPEDVFWLQDRWRPGRREPLVQEGKPVRGGEAGTKPRRVLVVGEFPPASLPAVGPEGSVRWEPVVTVAGESAVALAQRLIAADEAEVLPVECVLGDRRNRVLISACRRAKFILIDAEGRRL
ncbi:MAG: lysophospholipid acyltransferase family protein [Verrucomicrobiota bacterium]